MTNLEHDVVVMFSGGIDSTVLLYDLLLTQSMRPLALHYAGLTSDYEISVCQNITERLGVELVVIDVRSFLRACVPKHATPRRADGRLVFGNAVVFSMALTFALARGVPNVAVGLNRNDATTYIENNIDFLDYIRAGLQLIDGDCSLLAPYHAWPRERILRQGLELGIDMKSTFSCTLPIDGMHDGTCDSCQDRRAAFVKLGVSDPTEYAACVRSENHGESGI